MRYLLDTNILLYMLSDDGQLSSEVEEAVRDYGNQLYICAASVRELGAAWHKYTWIQKKWKSPKMLLHYFQEQFGVIVLYPQREHYETFLGLEWNLAQDHRDTTDLLIIAHAITERMPLISSDRKFDFYTQQGLDFIYNRK